MTSADRILTMQVLSLNMQAPYVEDEYTTIDKLELTDESLIFYESMDDKLLGTSALEKSELEVLKQGIIHGLSLSPVKDIVINAHERACRQGGEAKSVAALDLRQTQRQFCWP